MGSLCSNFKGEGFSRKTILIMSTKIGTILKACKQNRIEQALGAMEVRYRPCGVERTCNMLAPWGSNTQWTDSSTTNTTTSSCMSSSSPSLSTSFSTSSPHITHGWNSSNTAQYNDGALH